jgi:hypothetical protein
MKRIAQKTWLLAISFILFTSADSFSQDLTGIWRGYFIADNGEQYRLEFQIKQKQTLAVTGVSYSYLDVRFYGKATMTGSFIKNSKNFRIKEIKTVEVKSITGGGTCIMNYDLAYSTSGKEEFLEGTYLGKQEVRTKPNPYQWGDCGGGTVYLRKVPTSDFYIEPFLRKNPATVSPVKKDTAATKKNPPVVKKTTPTAKTNKPLVKKTSPTAKTNKPPTKKITKPIAKTTIKPKIDTTAKTNIPVVKNPVKITTSAILKERQNELMKSLTVTDPDVTIKLYDNGEIDDDTISVFYDKKLMLSNKRLSAAPIILKLKMEDDGEDHELVMVAENLGRIPPNTSLMIVEAGDQRFDVRITSTAQKNALVRFKYQPPAELSNK